MHNQLGKYALIRTETTSTIKRLWILLWLRILPLLGIRIDRGAADGDEFFVIKLKDRNAASALYGYIESLRETPTKYDPRFLEYVEDLADLAREIDLEGHSKYPDTRDFQR